MQASRLLTVAGGLAGLAAVFLASAGNHWFAEHISRPEQWRTALALHWAHVPCVLVCALAGGGQRLPMLAALCWLGGILLFCGTLYLRAAEMAGVPSVLAPAGGILFMLGWVGIVVHGLVWRQGRG